MSHGCDSIFRLPPYVLGPRVFFAHELDDQLDWGQKAINLPEIWKKSRGEGIRVGVLDTGRPNHPDLAGAIVKSKNFSSSFTDLDQASGHSTHVCGTLGARANGVGVVGVAPECEIVIAKVLGDDGSGSGRDIARGVRWCVEQGCHILSMSLGGGVDQEMVRACRDAASAGILVICAAGNEGRDNSVGSPASDPSTIAVASYDIDGNLSPFSSRGPQVTVAGPGGNILSTWLNNSYRRLSGSSMATPFVSGLAANLLGYQKKAEREGHLLDPPIRSNSDLLEHIRKSAIDKGPPGRDPSWGWGIIDPNKFYDTVRTSAPEPDPIVVTTTPEPPITGPGYREHDLLYGMVKIKEPVQFEGKSGVFIQLNV